MRINTIHILTSLITLLIACNQSIPYADGIGECDRIHNERIEAEMAKLKSGLKTSPVLKTPECLVGVRLPECDIETSNQKFSINKLKGKKTILCFWESNCPPCIYRIPIYNKLKSQLGEENYNFISVGLDTKENIISTTDKYNWKYIHATNGRLLIEEVFELNFGYPVTFLVDENLVIQAIIPSSTKEEVETGDAYSELLKIIMDNA